MKKNKNIGFVQGLVILPVMTMSLSMGGVASSNMYPTVSGNVLVQKLSLGAQDPQVLVDKKAEAAKQDLRLAIEKARADAIDAYFNTHDMPLEGTGMKMVVEAESNDLDWRLLSAIAVRESTGGKHDCVKVPNNAFGWGSCKIGFKSNDVAIETVARNLGGNNPKTAQHYDNKTTIQILHAYNPPSIVPKYAEQVMKIMEDIGSVDLGVVANS